ncbi:MAG: DinB family protein [Thermaerobacter sp.]|jgi:uncharacterized damage-inducible protein DinB|nr:DinB family protein [Thermaerobacter sp.]MDA8144629.1 DinB family protein [Thermaerobacter sp.]
MGELAAIRKILDGVRRGVEETVAGVAPGETWRPSPAAHPDDEAAYRSGMAEEELNWSPARGVNSAGALLVHLAAAQRYWIGQVIGGRDSHRDRPAEFVPRILEQAAVLREYRETNAAADGVLEGLSDADLDREVEGAGGRTTVREVLLRLIAHFAHHRGQLLLLKRLLHPAQSSAQG